MAARVMTMSAIGLLLAAVAFVLAEILGAVGVFALPVVGEFCWAIMSQAAL